MIVKIWPIKADYAGDNSKVGGIEGLKNAYEYITDADKVIVSQDNLMAMNVAGLSGDAPEIGGDDQRRVLNYMSNEDKIEGKYISGYMCDPDTAVSAFNESRVQTLKILNRKTKKETGAVAFHLVQSFPEGLNISDEEVHQCGLELCEKINSHQAVVCSHVHPVKDEDGEVHGKAKHNHILINAYIHPDKLDPAHPERAKYNDCKETYAQLRIWNDEIAIAHGLPIIRNPDDDRVYSWMETDAINKGISWKQRIRIDIEETKKASSCWEDFVQQMEAAGYKIKDGADVTYIAPDKKHRARGKALGRLYTKENLQLYWDFKNRSYQPVEQAENDNPSPPLLDFVLNTKDSLAVAVPLGLKKYEQRDFAYLPLDNASQPYEVLLTYFNENALYDICDEHKRSVRAATGKEIVECMEQLRRGKQFVLDQQAQPQEEQKETGRVPHKSGESDRYYINIYFINSRTKRPYRSSLYDKYGRRRTMLELILLLAIAVLKKEDGLWDMSSPPPDQANDPIYAPRAWKIQNMIDSIYTAQEENIETPAQLDQRLKDAGSAYSRAKSALKKTVEVKEKMETLNKAVKEYRDTQTVAQRILDLPEGPEKEQACSEYADIIDRYKTAKAVLYRYKVTTEADITDFEQRYVKIQKDIEECTDRVDKSKEEYRKLKKLSYNVELAQNTQYCYGPDYKYDNALQQEQKQESDEKRNERDARNPKGQDNRTDEQKGTDKELSKA